MYFTFLRLNYVIFIFYLEKNNNFLIIYNIRNINIELKK